MTLFRRLSTKSLSDFGDFPDRRSLEELTLTQKNNFISIRSEAFMTIAALDNSVSFC